MSDEQTEEDRRALLAAATLYGVDLLAIGTEHPDGSVTLDWDVLERAVAEKRATSDPLTRPA